MQNQKSLKSVALVIAVVSIVFFIQQRFSETRSVKSDPARTRANKLPRTVAPDKVSAQETIKETTKDVGSTPIKTPSLQDLREIASKIEEYKQLPLGADQDWVLENAENSLKAETIKTEQLPLHISQLASIRMFTALDRQEVYSENEAVEIIEENEENL